MLSGLRQMWRAAPVASVLLAGAMIVALVFCVRISLNWVYWNDPAHRDQQIAGWMTPRYVAQSWDVPPEIVARALDVSRHDGRPENLSKIAARRGVSPDALIGALQSAITQYRTEAGQ